MFYKTLYLKAPGGNIDQIDNFLNTLSEEQNAIMTADITEGELKNAISRLKTKQLPGSDSYTAEWNKEFKEVLTPILLSTLNWVLKKAHRPSSWKEAII